MNILGPDALAFGVDDVGACRDCLTAFGLNPVDVDEAGGFFEALDGTGVLVRGRDDPRLPGPLETATMLRQTVYGVADQATVDAIGDELSRDRQVARSDDGSVETKDDLGFALKFQVTQRRKLEMDGEKINAPGSPPQRGPNTIGVWQDMPAKPRTLSHVVCFVPDIATAEAFYVNRLGFKVTDRLLNAGPFLRPAGSSRRRRRAGSRPSFSSGRCSAALSSPLASTGLIPALRLSRVLQSHVWLSSPRLSSRPPSRLRSCTSSPASRSGAR